MNENTKTKADIDVQPSLESVTQAISKLIESGELYEAKDDSKVNSRKSVKKIAELESLKKNILANSKLRTVSSGDSPENQGFVQYIPIIGELIELINEIIDWIKGMTIEGLLEKKHAAEKRKLEAERERERLRKMIEDIRRQREVMEKVCSGLPPKDKAIFYDSSVRPLKNMEQALEKEIEKLNDKIEDLDLEIEQTLEKLKSKGFSSP